LFDTYKSVPEFREKLPRQLAQTVIRSFVPKKKYHRHEGPNEIDVPRNRPKMPALSKEAKQILLEACQDQNGIVLRIRTTSSMTIHTNGHNMVETRNPRIAALWDAALRELTAKGLLQDRETKEEVFSVTDDSYRVADLLRDQQFPIVSAWPTFVEHGSQISGRE
jgi:hypothetical protein